MPLVLIFHMGFRAPSNASSDLTAKTWNYPQRPNEEFTEENSVSVTLDSEGCIPFRSASEEVAYLKKSAVDVDEGDTGKDGLFDMTLDIKGNTVQNLLNVVFVLDYSFTMSQEKLQTIIEEIQTSLETIEGYLADGTVRVSAVAYNREVYSMGLFSDNMHEVTSFFSNLPQATTGTFTQKGLYEAQTPPSATVPSQILWVITCFSKRHQRWIYGRWVKGVFRCCRIF